MSEDGPSAKRALIIHPDDVVAVALEDLEPGDRCVVALEDRMVRIEVRNQVPFGHKIALRRLEPGEAIIKYGEEIGRATAAIEPGEWIHSHNLYCQRGKVQ